MDREVDHCINPRGKVIYYSSTKYSKEQNKSKTSAKVLPYTIYAYASIYIEEVKIYNKILKQPQNPQSDL